MKLQHIIIKSRCVITSLNDIYNDLICFTKIMREKNNENLNKLHHILEVDYLVQCFLQLLVLPWNLIVGVVRFNMHFINATSAGASSAVFATCTVKIK